MPEDPTNPSCQLLNFDVNKKDDDKPYETLGKLDWTGGPDGKTPPEVETEMVDGRERQSVTFWSPPVQGFRIAKTYSLTEGEYHLRLGGEGKAAAQAATLDPNKVLPFRYQMTSFHGLPVEGRWYTNYFRNALIGQVDSKTGYVSRDLQDLRQTISWEGGNPVERQPGYILRYAGVAVQYLFASVIVVDNQQEKAGLPGDRQADAGNHGRARASFRPLTCATTPLTWSAATTTKLRRFAFVKDEKAALFCRGTA